MERVSKLYIRRYHTQLVSIGGMQSIAGVQTGTLPSHPLPAGYLARFTNLQIVMQVQPTLATGGSFVGAYFSVQSTNGELQKWPAFPLAANAVFGQASSGGIIGSLVLPINPVPSWTWDEYASTGLSPMFGQAFVTVVSVSGGINTGIEGTIEIWKV